MSLQLILRLKKVQYSGESIGRDIQFTFQSEDTVVNFRRRIQLTHF